MRQIEPLPVLEAAVHLICSEAFQGENSTRRTAEAQDIDTDRMTASATRRKNNSQLFLRA
jgi:hypothetical protein